MLTAVRSARRPSSPVTGGHSGRGGIEKRLDLALRAPLFIGIFLDGDLGHPVRAYAGPFADHSQDFLMQIHRDIGVILEQPKPPLRLQADATCRALGDAAIRETQACVRNVDLLGENAAADRIDRGPPANATMLKMRSMSWIIKSSTTSTSVPRCLNGAAGRTR